MFVLVRVKYKNNFKIKFYIFYVHSNNKNRTNNYLSFIDELQLEPMVPTNYK